MQFFNVSNVMSMCGWMLPFGHWEGELGGCGDFYMYRYIKMIGVEHLLTNDQKGTRIFFLA